MSTLRYLIEYRVNGFSKSIPPFLAGPYASLDLAEAKRDDIKAHIQAYDVRMLVTCMDNGSVSSPSSDSGITIDLN